METLTVHVIASDATRRSGVIMTLRRAGVELAAEPHRSPDTLIAAAAGTVTEALLACPPKLRSDGHRMLVVADRFAPADVAHALRSGVRAMLRSADATPSRLIAALQSARDGEGQLPREALVGAFSGALAPTWKPRTASSPSPLTARQTRVLELMAEGQDNATIARSLVCSQHTVKNVIYDLMVRLQVRNRAHAVACGVRSGLI
jgi:DNA-binding NarL/FixJ family response regulator